MPSQPHSQLGCGMAGNETVISCQLWLCVLPQECRFLFMVAKIDPHFNTYLTHFLWSCTILNSCLQSAWLYMLLSIGGYYLRCDQNQDGTIDYTEFTKYLTGTQTMHAYLIYMADSACVAPPSQLTRRPKAQGESLWAPTLIPTPEATAADRQRWEHTLVASTHTRHICYRVILCSHFFVNVRYMSSPLKKVRGRSITYKLLIGWY